MSTIKRTTKRATKKTKKLPTKKRAAKSKPKSQSKPKSKKSKTLDVDALLARNLEAMSGVYEGVWKGGESARIADEVVAAVQACLDVERADVATTIGQAVPAPQRGRVLLHLALAGHGEIEDAVDAILEAVELVEPGAGACRAAAFALDSAKRLEGRTKKRKELLAAAASVVDACFESNSLYDVDPIAHAYMHLGERSAVKSMLERAGKHLPDRLAGVVWALESPREILALVNRSNADSAFGSEWVDLDGWSLEMIAELADCAMGTWARPELAARLLKLGRKNDARTLVIDDPAWDDLMLPWKAERYILVGEPDEAKRLLAEEDPPVNEFISWAEMQRELGLRDYAQLWPLAAQRDPDTSVMAPIQRLTTLADRALDAGASPDEVAPAIAAIEGLLEDSFRTQYDRGVEGPFRNRFAKLRARVQMARGEGDEARARVEQDFANIAELLQYAKDSFAKTGLLSAFAVRAVMVGRPDIALKAAMKIPKSNRPASAAVVAHGFLPAAPGDAIAAVDRLAKDLADKVLLDGKGLLAALWTAVLSASS